MTLTRTDWGRNTPSARTRTLDGGYRYKERGQPATLAKTADNRCYNLGGGGRLNKTHLSPGAQLELRATELGTSTDTHVCVHALPPLEEDALRPLLGSTVLVPWGSTAFSD